MKHFTFKQCALALCLGLASFLPGQSIATNAPDVSSPIGMELAEQEESGYAFSSRNTHAEYERVSKNSNGYSGQRSKQMWLDLPSGDSKGVYIKARLKDPIQASTITFRVSNQDQAFTDGAIWITPSACSLSGTTQSIPFGARVTAPGTYPYTVEAYVNQDDETPVATWDATFYFMENVPSITAPANLYDNSFDFDVLKGDLDATIYLEVQYFVRGTNNRPTSFTAEGFSTTDGRNWRTEPMSIADKHYSATFISEGTLSGQFQIYIKDAEGNNIYTKVVRVCYPFVPATSDLAAIERLASLNPTNADLNSFVNNKLWKEDLYGTDANVKVEWAQNGDSVHVSRLEIKNQESLTLDLKGLDYIGTLVLSGNKTIKAPLDLSHMSKLEHLYMYNGVSLTYNEVILPESFNKSNVSATSKIREIGSPRENGDVEVPINTVLDLSAYIGEPIEGSTLTYSWRKNWNNIELTPVDEGTFKLSGQVGDHYSCTIRNSLFPNWSIETPQIYLVQSELIFDERDVAGLKKLATDNPQNEEIKAFIENGVWKESNLYPDNSPMGVKWVVDENNKARLSHLRLNLNGCYEESIAPTKMDLSAFTELVYFNTSSNYYIDKMDFSHNTKLEEIRLEYAYTMTSVDLSPCKNLKTLWLNHLNVMETVDLSANTKLEYLRVYDNRLLRSLNLSALSNLNTLSVTWCPNLSQLSDLSNHPLLKELTVGSCSNLKTLSGLDKLSLKSLFFTNSDSLYKEALKTVDFAEITYLSYAGSNYSLPDSGKAPKLQTIQLPQTLKELNLNHYPSLYRLRAYSDPGPALPYSGIKNYRSRSSYTDEQGNYHEGMSYDGSSLIPMPGAKKVLGERYPCIAPEDTIDLSSEAIFNGKESHFIWIDCDNNTEVKDLFVAIKDQPGLFTIDPKAALNESGSYRCKIWNEAFSDGAGVDWSSGWILDTEHFKIPNGETAYNLEEMEMLQTIVNNSSSQGLKDWWEQGQWMFDHYRGEDGSFYVYWNDNHRLDRLLIQNFNDRMTGCLDVSPALELKRLYVNYTDFTECVYPANPKLEVIDYAQSKLVLPIDQEFPSLQRLCTSEGQTKLDLSKLPALTNLWLIWHYTQSHLKFSDITAHRKLNEVWGSWNCFWIMSDKIYGSTNYIGENDSHIIDLSSEINVGAKVQWQTMNADGSYQDISPIETEPGKYNLSEALLKQKRVKAICSHDSFPGWTPFLDLSLYTEPGDANIDGKVNVQDISATLPYVLEDYTNRSAIFGEYQADMDKNQAIEVADVVGIVNTIRGVTNPVLKSTFQPIVYVTSKADGKLYVDTQVPLSGLQLTFTGVEQEIPLLGEAAHFAHAAHATDSLRMVAYSMDASTIPAGRTLLAQLPKGATLVEALFADENAQSLKADLSGIVTATEEIGNDLAAQQVTNYPNPFQGQTTFTYGVEGQADQAVIRIYATNGALVRVLTGLPVAPGENQYRATVDLPAGLYLYRLEISRAGRVISTQTNNLIIK